MAFNCMNINSSFLKMLNFGKTSEPLSGFTDFSKEGILFKEQFAKMFEGGQLKTSGSKTGNSVFDKFISFLSKELKGLTGTDFLKKLEQAFEMISGQGLKGLTIGEQGLDALKELLADAGFDMDQIIELIDEFKLVIAEEGQDISIDSLMNEITELELKVSENNEVIDDETTDTVLPLSAIPFIETIMASLDIPADVRESILSGATTDKGVDLTVLIKNLKEFEQKSFAEGKYFKTDNADNTVAKLLNQLDFGIRTKAFHDGKLSLQDFISILDDKMKEIVDYKSSKGSETVFKSPLKGIKIQLTHIDAKSSPVDIEANPAEVKVEGERKLGNLISKLFKSINNNQNTDEKIVNVPLNKFSNKNMEHLFPFHAKGENGKEVQMEVKSELEDKFARFLVKLESDMNGRNDSESRNGFNQGRQKNSPFKMPDSSQAVNPEGKTLNSLRYLSSAKNENSKPLPSYVTNQIGRSIIRAVNQGQSEIKLQLKPPELGRMMITIEDMGNGMKVSILAENQNARDILVSNSNNLKIALANSGVNLENFDVDMGSDFNRSMSDADNQAGNSGKKRNFKNEEIDGEGVRADNTALLKERHLNHDGTLYYVA